MMYAMSILFKTAAFLLWATTPAGAALLFVAGAVLDGVAFRQSAGISARTWTRIIGDTAALNLAALVAGLAAWEVGIRATLTWKEGLPWVAHAAAWLLRATGLQAAASGGFVHLTTMAGPLRFATSWDALGLEALLLVLAFAVVTILYRAANWTVAVNALLRVVATLWAVSLLRFTLWILLFVTLTVFMSYETESLPVTLFVRPYAVVALFLPFLPLCLRGLTAASGHASAGVESPPKRAEKGRAGAPSAPPGAHKNVCRYGKSPQDRFAHARRVVRGGALWALFAVLVLFAVWEPRGIPVRGKVLIDGYRAQWSPADRPYDREWYGADSGYNYACLRRWFDAFYETDVLDGPIRAGTLDDASVLVVYLPDRPYSQDEIRRIAAFVRRGGGLLLIGDHTNVFGSTSHLNALCARLGMQFRYDVLFDLDTHFFQMFEPSHPRPRWLHGMRFMKLRGAASVRPTALSTRTFMTVANTKGLPSIYSVGNFYPPPHDDPRMTFGRYAIATAARAGSGRVVAFADSTIFSNFEIYYPGKYELLLNMVHWLDGSDSPWRGPARRMAALAAVLLALALAWRARQPRAVLAVMIAILLVFGIARGWARRAEAAAATFPTPRQALRGVFFIADADDPAYILREFTSDEPYDQRYDVFIQWVLRTGAFSGFRLVPTGAGDELYSHLREQPLAETALALIVRDDRQLAYLDMIAADTGSRRVLLLFSRDFERERIAAALVDAGLVDDADALAPAWTGWPDGEAVIEAGGRRLLLVFAAERFSDRRMGITEKAVPDAALRAHFERAYTLIDRLFE